ncbi:hypothetical protein ANTPLA_LOCUS6017 [Anthophora plagiata]
MILQFQSFEENLKILNGGRERSIRRNEEKSRLGKKAKTGKSEIGGWIRMVQAFAQMFKQMFLGIFGRSLIFASGNSRKFHS